MKIKLKTAALLCLAALFLTGAPFCPVFADSWNGEGTGGEVGSATTNTYISNIENCSGIRVSVVDDAGGRVEGTKSVDYMWQVTGGSDAYHFSGKKNKIEYRACSNANDLSLVKGGYSYRNANEFASQLGPFMAMPAIVLKSGSNIQKIRDWLTDYEKLSIPNKIAKDCGLPPTPASEINGDTVNLYRNTLCQNNYHLMIEPVGSVVVQGVPYVGTATELAFLGQRSGCSWDYLGSYVDMQLPLSMYLSYTQLGIPASSFSATRQTREDVITYLGVAITTYQKDGTDITDHPYSPEDDPQPVIEVPPLSYSYHPDTEVYSSVKIENTSGSDILEDGTVTFHIVGGSLDEIRTMDGISLPDGGSQLAYCRWHTPSSGSRISIDVSASEGISLSTDRITCTISGAGGTEPPDPKVTDRRGNWSYPSSPMPGSSSAGATWGHWDYTSTADKQIDVWYYHERGSHTYHRTGNRMSTSLAIPDSAYYRLADREVTPAEYRFGEWEQHTDEPWTAPDPSLYDIDGIPRSTRTVVTYLGSAPYVTKVTYYSRSSLSWYTNSSVSAGTRIFSSNQGSKCYSVNGGAIRLSEPSPSQPGDVLSVYTYLRTQSDATGQQAYVYRTEKYTAAYGSWYVTSSSTLYLSTDYGTSTTISLGSTRKMTYSKIRTEYSQKTYSGANSVADSRADTAVWNKKTSYTDYYTWRQRTITLEKPETVRYVYDMFDTSWIDNGSYWSTAKTSVTTQQKSWKWIDESVSLVSSAAIFPDERCVTSYESNGVLCMKSGYGIQIEYVPVLTSLGASKNGTVEVTPLQHNEVRFPEFNWSTYRRILQQTRRDPSGNPVYSFPVNKYSRLKSRVHFTPIWYPDGQDYCVRVYSSDLWTPAGEVSLWTQSGSIRIADGSCYDDWAIVLRP